MIDFQVAYDKLAGLETAEDIADLFRDYDVKGVRSDSESCAITVWMTEQTGLFIRTNNISVRAVDESGYRISQDRYQKLTKAMESFIHKFDFGFYPDLVK